MDQAELVATQDIREELSKSHKQFIPFIRTLDPKMKELVTNYYNKQTYPRYF